MKRERLAVLVLSAFLVAAGSVGAESKVKASINLTLDQFIGSTHKYLEPTKFPIFSGSCSENKTCWDWLAETLSGMERSVAARGNHLINDYPEEPERYRTSHGSFDSRCSGAGAFDFSTGQYDKAGAGGWISLGNPGYSVLEFNGSEDNAVSIPQEYRGVSKFLVTWKVRVEGVVPNGYECFSGSDVSGLHMRPLFCQASQACSIQEDFSGGQVMMQLYIKNGTNDGNAAKGADDEGWAKLDPITTITIPAIKLTATTRNTPRPPTDPTVTGSCMISKDEFEQGRLPAKVLLKLMWFNDSPVVAKSIANQRSLSAMLMPITDGEEGD